MARPRSIDDQRLLAAARKVFLAKGASATTAEVARAARVAEGSIFKRYRTKQELFRASIQSAPAPWMGILEEGAGGDLEEALVQVGLQIVALARKTVPFLLMSWSARGSFGAIRPSGSFRPVDDLRAFFEHEIRAGRIRRVDPWVLTSSYYGALQHYALVELIRKRHPVPLERFVRGFVGLLWAGIRPERRRGG